MDSRGERGRQERIEGGRGEAREDSRGGREEAREDSKTWREGGGKRGFKNVEG